MYWWALLIVSIMMNIGVSLYAWELYEKLEGKEVEEDES